MLSSRFMAYFKVVVRAPSLPEARQELETMRDEMKPKKSSVHIQFPIVTKYLLLAAWIASWNPNVDKETLLSRKRRSKVSVTTDAAREEDSMFKQPKVWRIDKLLSILDMLLAGNEDVRGDSTNLFQSDISAVPEDSSCPIELNEEFIWEMDGVLDEEDALELRWTMKSGIGAQNQILQQFGSLERSHFFVRQSKSTSRSTRSRTEWICNYDWSFVKTIAESLKVDLDGYLL